MRAFFNSGLLGGVTAAVIWMACAMLTNFSTHDVGLWALVILVAVTVISGLIGRAVAAGHAPANDSAQGVR